MELKKMHINKTLLITIAVAGIEPVPDDFLYHPEHAVIIL